MGMNKFVWLVLLILVSVRKWGCAGCWKEERDAFLQLNAIFDYPIFGWMDGTDCCQWEGVQCNTTTSQVATLYLCGLLYYKSDWTVVIGEKWSATLPQVEWFRSIFGGCGMTSLMDIVGSDKRVLGLENLRVLDLGHNYLNDTSIMSCLGDFSSLNSLNLEGNELTGKPSYGLSWPTSLEDLQLTRNNISNDIVSSLNDLQHLKSLDLSYNNLKGSLDISGVDALSKLETLDLSGNSIVNLGVHQGTKNLSSIKILKLDDTNFDGSMLRESLQAFSSIRRLSLSNNKFNGKIVAQDFGDLDKLEELSLDSSSNIKNEFFKSIGALTSLKFLDMSNCQINGTFSDADWSKLNKLEELELAMNAFEGPLPLSFSNLTSLRILQLSFNHFTGNIASILVSLTSLEFLEFIGNQFEVPASFTSLANHSYIKFIDGSGNKLIPDLDFTTQPWIPKFQLQEFVLSSTTESHSLPLPSFLFYQYNLTYVDLTNCKFDGEFPSWLLENNTKMTYLLLSNCSFTGHLQLPSHSNIQIIYASDNPMTGTIISKNNSLIFPNLKAVDLSNNNLFGSIPSSIFDISIESLDISNNNFGGKLPKDIANSSCLLELYMDNNHFEGYIPTEFVGHRSLSHLDLSKNNLSGPIPSLFNTSISIIYLSNNRLGGFSTRMFNESSSLILLDLSYNKIISSLHALVSSCTQLNILLLKGNNFMGPIPEQLCQLTTLTIVDLSSNILSGPLPKCLGKINLKGGNLASIIRMYYRYYAKITYLQANFSTKGRSYTYEGGILLDMVGLDLSHNILDGNIPFELGNLTEIRAINLSHNYLTGEIPTEFSNLKQIESLDLSFNKLSGTIPSRLIELNFLEVFSVAYNNISGTTPERKAQFMTFDESSYEGNPFLCGPPLRKSCTNHIRDPFASIPNAKEDNDGFLDMQVFYVSFVVTYTMVLLVMVAVLYINPYWRQTWFYFIEFVITSCYYFFVDYFYKLSTIRNM